MTPENFARFQRLKRLLQTTENEEERAEVLEQVAEAVPELLAELERFFDPAARPAVALESPFAGDVEGNTFFAKVAMADSITRGEAPFAGHLLYTQVLADAHHAERELGIRSHLAHVQRSQKVVVYVDLGISNGMQRAIDLADRLGIPIEERRIG